MNVIQVHNHPKLEDTLQTNGQTWYIHKMECYLERTSLKHMMEPKN